MIALKFNTSSSLPRLLTINPQLYMIQANSMMKNPSPSETQPLASYTASCYDSTTMSKPGTHHHESRTAALKIKFSSSPASQPAVLSSQPSHSCRCEFKLYSDTHLSPVFPLPASYIQYFTLFFSQQLCDLCTGRQHLLSL